MDTGTGTGAVAVEAVEATSALLARIGEQLLLVPAELVGEVTRMPDITRVPGLPGWLSGVVNARGQVLAVLDLRPLLTGTRSSGPRARLLRLAAGGIEFGLDVDAVEGVTDVDLGHCEPLPPGAAAADLLAGVVSVAGVPVPVLDLDALVRLRDRLG